jgi:hypothetical protein
LQLRGGSFESILPLIFPATSSACTDRRNTHYGADFPRSDARDAALPTVDVTTDDANNGTSGKTGKNREGHDFSRAVKIGKEVAALAAEGMIEI